MRELLIDVFLPVCNQMLRCRISDDITVKELCDFLIQSINDEKIEGYKATVNGCLFDKEDGRILEKNKTLLECGYQSGDELMFI